MRFIRRTATISSRYFSSFININAPAVNLESAIRVRHSPAATDGATGLSFSVYIRESLHEKLFI
jgi:hypothetical protein